MKIEQTSVVDYDEVDTGFRMKLPVLFQRLQRGALHHSESVGLGTAAMVAAGGVWILNRMRVDIYRMPVYRDELTLRTWHKGSVGFRAGRDFVVFCGDEKVAAATSLWLYYDLKRKRIAKIPQHVSEPYTAEADDVLVAGAIDFTVDKAFEPAKTLTITTREGDYDPNGHVNNAVYLEYLDTLIQRCGIGEAKVGQVGIEYLKEIGRGVDTILAGATVADNIVRFRFFDPTTVYAAGFVTIGKPG
jgi:medium-chain acyl-[acyl-carrier-protein] hydrolase